MQHYKYKVSENVWYIHNTLRSSLEEYIPVGARLWSKLGQDLYTVLNTNLRTSLALCIKSNPNNE